MSLSIPSGIFSIYNEAVDNIWSKAVDVYYPDRREECSNCYSINGRSNGVYKTGGPYPFDEGSICPLCDGEGIKYIATSETIYGRIYYDKRTWLNIGANVNYPDAVAQMVFKMTDLTKIQQCKYVVPKYYPGIEAYQISPLYRMGDYYPQGFTQNPTQYFVSYWGANGKP